MARNHDGTHLTTALLGELQARWERAGVPLVGSLRPGITGTRAQTLMAASGLSLPSEAAVWWGWHDGADVNVASGYARLGPEYQFLPLSAALQLGRESVAMAHDLADDDEDPATYWDPSWLPITGSSQGCIVVDCSVSDGDPTPIRKIDWTNMSPEEWSRPRASSFGELIHWWIEAYDSGAWQYTRDGGWQYDWTALEPEQELTRLF